jgi:sodium-dependent phosphate cotransporter
MNETAKTWLKVLAIVALLYLFLVSITLMGSSFKALKGVSEGLIRAAGNPFIGLFVGVFATSLIQSSSTTTSMVVIAVATLGLDVRVAIPIIMGANIGTSVTNTLASLAHINRRGEFRRAMACSTIHDIFNLMSVAIILPLELMFRPLERVSLWLGNPFVGSQVATTPGHFKKSLKFLSGFIKDDLIGGVFTDKTVIAVVGVVVSAALMVGALVYIVKVMKLLVLKKVEVFFDKFVGSHAIVAMGVGLVITVLVQSSSITTSMLVPMAGAGIISLAQAFPITLGANVGTTVTAIITALAKPGDTPEQAVAALSIAIAHLFFNLSGILLIYPIPSIRNIPIKLARRLAATFARKKIYAVYYILGVFFIIPGILIGVYKLIVG